MKLEKFGEIKLMQLSCANVVNVKSMMLIGTICHIEANDFCKGKFKFKT